MGEDSGLRERSVAWLVEACRHRYSYHFTWMGRPIIQFPQDIIAMQELVYRTKPEVIIETGVAHGGSLVFHASMMRMCGIEGRVVGVDIDIREHNRREIESHPMNGSITLIQGSSIAAEVVDQVRRIATSKRTMVVLDSNHTHAHVLEELRKYAPMVSVGCYCVVLDTIIEFMPEDFFPDRPWGRGNNPLTAASAFLAETAEFENDREIEQKLLVTVAPGGYLRRLR